ncbi:MAG: trehalose-phosphatase [Acidibrevibacterium sp.]|uniref:trehalose-phosphatase n=1 Tax=Acidibrevibacterium sp. TaxID=2606776 RepID=UPI003CFF3214
MPLSDLPPRERLALLLDFDGTLVELAPTPDSVVIPPGLGDLLARLARRLDGALALVSGRPLADLDHFLPGIPVALAGEHGGVFRLAPGHAVLRPDLPSVPQAWREAAIRLVAAHPGALYEPKARGLVVHYRAIPEAKDALAAPLAALVATDAERFALLPSHMAWEIRPRGADKGSAVRFLLARPPFAGRTPVFIGDDVTDADGMDAAREAGGQGVFVAEAFGDPAGVRAWLAGLA